MVSSYTMTAMAMERLGFYRHLKLIFGCIFLKLTVNLGYFPKLTVNLSMLISEKSHDIHGHMLISEKSHDIHGHVTKKTEGI